MNKTILIIEDEASLSSPISKALNDAGFQVFVEANGANAVDAAKQHKPDLVLLDIMLPGKTGWDIIKLIGKDYKVIIMSNLDSATREFEFFNDGAIDYLVKANSSLADIVKKVQSVINEK